MIKRITTIVAALGLLAAMGMSMSSIVANAGTTKCWRGTGGWYCY